MKKLHAKSPCCRGETIHFGNRRRQRCVCKKTWRIRQKKRGRKRRREQKDFLVRYLRHEIPSLYALARKKKVGDDRLRARLIRSRNHFIKHANWSMLPQKGNLIAVADAMVRFVEDSWQTFYFILIRKAEEDEAIIAPLFIKEGRETAEGWFEAFEHLPKSTKASIKALVCDGHNGLTSYAKWNNWLIQRCHFHLLAAIQSRRSKWKYSRHSEEGKKLYDLAKRILTDKDEKIVNQCVNQIEDMGWTSKSTILKKILLGFVTHHQDFRTYLYDQKLNLPTTSNSVESFIGCVQSLCHRARGFRTLTSYEKWIEALIKYKKKIKCRGFYQPN